MSNIKFNTPIIEVPKQLSIIDKKGKIKKVNVLTKANNIASKNKLKAIQLKPNDNNEIVIISKGRDINDKIKNVKLDNIKLIENIKPEKIEMKQVQKPKTAPIGELYKDYNGITRKLDLEAIKKNMEYYEDEINNFVEDLNIEGLVYFKANNFLLNGLQWVKYGNLKEREKVLKMIDKPLKEAINFIENKYNVKILDLNNSELTINDKTKYLNYIENLYINNKIDKKLFINIFKFYTRYIKYKPLYKENKKYMY